MDLVKVVEYEDSFQHVLSPSVSAGHLGFVSNNIYVDLVCSTPYKKGPAWKEESYGSPNSTCATTNEELPINLQDMNSTDTLPAAGSSIPSRRRLSASCHANMAARRQYTRPNRTYQHADIQLSKQAKVLTCGRTILKRQNNNYIAQAQAKANSAACTQQTKSAATLCTKHHDPCVLSTSIACKNSTEFTTPTSSAKIFHPIRIENEFNQVSHGTYHHPPESSYVAKKGEKENVCLRRKNNDSNTCLKPTIKIAPQSSKYRTASTFVKKLRTAVHVQKLLSKSTQTLEVVESSLPNEVSYRLLLNENIRLRRELGLLKQQHRDLKVANAHLQERCYQLTLKHAAV